MNQLAFDISSAHEHLKKQTWALHKKLDQLPALSCMMQNDLSLAQYRGFLEKMYCFHATVQPLVFASLADYRIDDLGQRDKLPALRRDLQALDVDVSCMDAQLAGCCLSLTQMEPASMLGALYVMEGSTQGGQFLQQKILSRFDRQDIVNFFRVYGDLNGVFWKKFLEHLNTSLVSSDEQAAAVKGAEKVYQILLELFKESHV